MCHIRFYSPGQSVIKVCLSLLFLILAFHNWQKNNDLYFYCSANDRICLTDMAKNSIEN